jgi:D-glycero-alpha-D-manno-heptose-7-phosphate kinase
MSGRSAEASAPARIDLAGGTLDIWPVYLFHPGAVTVNVAIDRRAWTRAETGKPGVRIESKDTLVKHEGRDVAEVLALPNPPLAAYVLRALGIETGIRVSTQSKVPAGSGLGGSSALAVTIAAASGQATGRPLTPEALVALVRDAEAQAIGVPTGVQDYHAAVQGGVLAVHLEPGGVRALRLDADPAKLEEALLLVDAGETRFSGINNWEVFKSRIDGEERVRVALDEIASVARRLMEALESHRYHDVASLVAEEWEARKRLAPGVTSPSIDRIAEVARSAGGAAKVCGAGGGGMVAVWATPGSRAPGNREAVELALKEAGFRPLKFRVDLRGLEME